MFTKLTVYFAAFFMAFFVAVSNAVPTSSPNTCSSGELQCCDQTFAAASPAGAIIAALAGVALDGVTGQIGGTCSPITLIGASGSSCSSTAVCCDNNKFSGVVAFGCNPVKL